LRSIAPTKFLKEHDFNRQSLIENPQSRSAL
jgi:hypothetical protein